MSAKPLKKLARRQAVVDVALRRILLEAAKQARAEALRLEGKERIGSQVRAAQLQLQAQQLRMWAKVGNVIDDNMLAVGEDVSDLFLSFNKDVMRRIRIRPNSAMAQSLSAQARSTINNYVARQHMGMTLSERVYKNAVVSSGRLDKIIDKALLQGKSARELAKDVYRMVNPNTPGGASYAAMRLARTELNNAFHESQREMARSNPFTSKMTWNLSGSHPRTDECDSLVGEYDIDDVPDKPHPQCLCYIEPMPMDEAELVRRFRRGEFDEWADRQLAG